MPLFQINNTTVQTVSQTNFKLEKDLQQLVERNLQTIFNCQFVATEFVTGAQHAGRIDTLALSEDNNPVIIEYKIQESSSLLNQSLYYLAWLQDHRGDFEIAAHRELGEDVEVDWSDVRVICIAPGYRKYDLYAASVMGANLELWRYRLYDNNIIHFEEIHGATRQTLTESTSMTISPISSEPKPTYSFEEHHANYPKTESLRELVLAIDDFILGLDSAIERAPKKFYVAYKTSQNIVCMEVQSRAVKLHLKLDSNDIEIAPSNYRDTARIGTYGTGNAEFTVRDQAMFELTKPFIEQAYQKVGG